MLLQAKQQREISQLRLNLGTYFIFNELRTLCFDLSIDYDNLSNSTKETFARELIVHMMYQRRLTQLLNVCRELRPHIDWPEITETINQTISTQALQAAVKSGKISAEESQLLQKLERFLTQGMLEKFAPISEHLLLKQLPALKVKAHTRAKQTNMVFDTFDMRYLRNSMATSFGIPNNALLVLGNPQASKPHMLVECRKLMLPTLKKQLSNQAH